jgi:hypothetical protein
VEFEADSSDQAIVDQTLDEILLFQPSCTLISKATTVIDFESGGGNPSVPVDAGRGGSNKTIASNHKPYYSAHDGDHEADGYDPESFRPSHRGQAGGDGSSTSQARFRHRYDSFVEGMRLALDGHTYLQAGDYPTPALRPSSPPCHRSRSASPVNDSTELRRSKRIRTATANAKPPKGSSTAHLYLPHENPWKSRPYTVHTRPDTVAPLSPVRPTSPSSDSLLRLASATKAPDLKRRDRSRFERQQRSMFTFLSTGIKEPICFLLLYVTRRLEHTSFTLGQMKIPTTSIILPS